MTVVPGGPYVHYQGLQGPPSGAASRSRCSLLATVAGGIISDPDRSKMTFAKEFIGLATCNGPVAIKHGLLLSLHVAGVHHSDLTLE